MRKSQKLLLFIKKAGYLLLDTFSQTIAAGSVNGTPADIGGTRTIVDANSKISLINGILNWATGGATNDKLEYGSSYARLAGRMFLATIVVQSGSSRIDFGWGATGAYRNTGFTIRASDLRVSDNVLLSTLLFPITLNTPYKIAGIMRAAGTFLFVKGGTEYPKWTLLHHGVTAVGTGIPFGMFAESTTSIQTFDNIRIPIDRWLPTPSVSDGFSVQATTDGAGHAETSGLGSGGKSLTWADQGATWVISAGKVANTPSLGSELITNGDMSSGTGWTQGTGWTIAAGVATHAATGAGDLTQAVLTANTWYQAVYTLSGFSAGTIQALFGTTKGPTRATNATFTETNLANGTAAGLSASGTSVDTGDNVSYKALTLNTLFRVLTSMPKDCHISTLVTLLAGTQAGVVLNLDSAVTPANFVIAYHDGTNAVLLKCVAGVYTSVISAAATYSAGAILRVIKNGTSYSLYYNLAQVGTTQTISDAGIINNTIHGLFSTNSGNTLDNFTVYPNGNNNEYSALDAF